MIKSAIMGALLATTCTLATAAGAAVLYDNGPSTYEINAWNIGDNFQVANSFTLSSAAVVTGFTFVTWNDAVSPVGTVTWSIGSSPFGSATTSAPTSSQYLLTNGSNFSIWQNTVSIGALALDAGTYWLSLGDVRTQGGSGTNWNINNGPSEVRGTAGDYPSFCAEFVVGGTTCGTSFTILGPSSGAVPEPASWTLMIAGFGPVGTALRRRAATSALHA